MVFLQVDTTSNSWLDTIPYEVVTDNTRVAEVVDELSKHKVIGVDTENTGLDEHTDKPLLLQIGTSHAVYIFHTYDPLLDIEPIKRLLEDPNIVKVFFNAKYDYRWLFANFGIRTKNLFCSQVGERLLNAGKPGASALPRLTEVLYKYLAIKMSKEVRSSFINRDPISDPFTEEEYKYSIGDTAVLPDVYYQEAFQAERDELLEVFQLEMDVLPSVAEAESYGCLIDQDRWRDTLEVAKSRQKSLEKEIFACFEGVVAQKNLFGLPLFNIASPPQLKKNLARLGFELEDTNESVLSSYKDAHPVFPLLMKHRSYTKIISAYGEKLLSKINKVTGRLHANFNQVRAVTGRMSSSAPNLQQIPGYDPDDPDSLDFRSCFVAAKGRKLITADFSQQELRILADMSGDPTFYKAYTELDEDGNTLDVHRYTASVIFEIPYKEVTDQQRKKAKSLNFFLVYGGGAYSLAETLGCTKDEAQAIIDGYFKRYAKIKLFLDKSANDALNKGFITTISNRRRYVPLPYQDDPRFEKEKEKVRREGKNTRIQGSGADVTKKAMAFLYNALVEGGYDATIMMVVHDEFVVDVCEEQAEEVAKIVEREMIRGFTHFFKKIPMTVDAHIGDTWEK